ncbi:MAG: hypothetical protein RLY93_11570 [Sumerlaeia bacterium]
MTRPFPSIKQLPAFLRIALCLALMGLAAGPALAAEALPLIYTPTGVLFRVKAPDASSVYIAGTFNGWANSDGYTVSDPESKMFGPDENGVFEHFYTLTPGVHVFKYCVNGTHDGWMPGPPDLERRKDDFDVTAGQGGTMGSAFEFSLEEPPWPGYIPNGSMRPRLLVSKMDGKPYLRVRFFSRQANIVHIVGSWDGWAGISDRGVYDEYHAAAVARRSDTSEEVPYVWEKYIGPLEEGTLEYKIVVNNRQWLADPSVLQASEDGNSVVGIRRLNESWVPVYTPRFPDNQTREDIKKRWGPNLEWEIGLKEGFDLARANRKPMIWVITLPGSAYSERFMKGINSDPAVVQTLKSFVCLETPANEVRNLLRKYQIYRVPYVAIFDSAGQVKWRGFNPSEQTLKQQLAGIS